MANISTHSEVIKPPKEGKWKWIQNAVMETLLDLDPVCLRVYMYLLLCTDKNFSRLFPRSKP